MQYQNLSVGAAARANADDGDVEFGGDIGSQLGGDAFKNQQARPGVLYLHRIGQNRFGFFRRAALYPVATKDIHGLRR